MSERFPPDRSRPLAVAAAASILLAAYVIGKEDRVRELAPSTPVRASGAQRVAIRSADAPRALPMLDLEKLNRVKPDEPAVNLFSSEIRVALPPMPAVSLAPVTPVPPPVPSAPRSATRAERARLAVHLRRQTDRWRQAGNISIPAGHEIQRVHRRCDRQQLSRRTCEPRAASSSPTCRSTSNKP